MMKKERKHDINGTINELNAMNHCRDYFKEIFPRPHYAMIKRDHTLFEIFVDHTFCNEGHTNKAA